MTGWEMRLVVKAEGSVSEAEVVDREPAAIVVRCDVGELVQATAAALCDDACQPYVETNRM